MRNSPDLILQNLLARAASLLFRVGETLGEGPCPPTQTLLKIEIATFFLEGKSSLSEALLEKETPMQKESDQSAPSAGNSGPESTWDYPNLARENTSSPDGLVYPTGTTIERVVLSGNSSSGGTGDFPPLSNSPSPSSPPNSSEGKSSSAQSRSLGKFILLMTASTPCRHLLVAKDDISNVISAEGGGSWIYYKSQVDADQVCEPLVTIMELLND